MSRKQNLYVGRAGQMAVMAEFLWRGWNTALPEVDMGEDIFVIEDETGILWRVQVKTATAQQQWDGYTAQFNVSLQQLEAPRTPDLVYVFVIRNPSSGWEPFVIIDREILLNEHEKHGVGSVSQGNLVLASGARNRISGAPAGTSFPIATTGRGGRPSRTDPDPGRLRLQRVTSDTISRA